MSGPPSRRRANGFSTDACPRVGRNVAVNDKSHQSSPGGSNAASNTYVGPMPRLTSDRLSQSFSYQAVSRGRAYFRGGRATVLEIGLEEDGWFVAGDVAGSGVWPYDTRVHVEPKAQGLVRIRSHCTCPVGQMCKHAVALLLQAMEDGLFRGQMPKGDFATGSRLAGLRPGAAQDLVPTDVAAWLADMKCAVEGAGEDYPPDLRQRLIYRLFLHIWPVGALELRVAPMSVRLLKDGSFSRNASLYHAANVAQGGARFLRPSDRTILRRLIVQSTRNLEGYTLRGEAGAEVLAMILGTGRARWGAVDGRLLSEGPARPGAVSWVLEADGRQSPMVTIDRGENDPELLVLPVTPPWYLELDHPEGARCGPVTIDMPAPVLETLLASPPLPASAVAAVRTRLQTILPESTAKLPAELPPPRQVTGPPAPCLRLHCEPVHRHPYWGSGRDPGSSLITVKLAALSFRYEDAVIDVEEQDPIVSRVSDDLVVEVVRDMAAERAALKTLKGLGFVPASARYDLGIRTAFRSHFLPAAGGPDVDVDDVWLAFLLDEVPVLRARGWEVALDEDFPLRPCASEGPIEAAVTEPGSGTGIDWFELNLGVPVDGERVDVLPALVDLLNRLPTDDLENVLGDDTRDGRRIRLPLTDGRILVMTFGQVRPILLAMTRLFGVGPRTAKLHLTAADAVDLAAFEDAAAGAGMVWRGGDALRALGRRLGDHAGIPPAAMPADFNGTLRPYQQQGVAWLQFLGAGGLGGVLADDMGLGKTVQALGHLAIEKAAGRLDRPALVIAPTSLIPNWRHEATVFAPHLNVLALQGPARKQDFGRLAEQDLVLSTYPLLGIDGQVLTAQPWHVLFLDEAQMVKNPSTTAAKVLRRLDARQRFALTGTPVENNLGELWALFDAVLPGFLGDRTGFTRQWRTPIEKKGDQERQMRLSRRVRPFLLRRTKAEVEKDLPDKTEIIENIEFHTDQRALYEGIRLAMHHKVRNAIARKGLARSRIELLEALLRLRQVCCDPRLFGTLAGRRKPPGSAKFDRLMEMVPELIAEGRRILLFSQFTGMLDLIAPDLSVQGIPFVTLTGQTRDRAAPVRQFQQGKVPLFLISLKAGGTGLNLTAADTVILYDPWWNPAVEAQATDRAHRIGQRNPVFVHKLITCDSIEVKMQELQARKRALAEGLFDPDGKTALDISEDDVEYLLGAD
ncbi:MAG: serine/threonine protein phosphatase [Rhodospirillales bacterium]|nr:MAG: serine/threonine protein phosphatase [Rhodospirillales bacterium]